jgi:phosphate transport system permease protein
MSTVPAVAQLPHRRHLADRIGDRGLVVLAALAALVAVATVVLIIVFIVIQAEPAISLYGFSFLWHSIWNPAQSVGLHNANTFGAGAFIFGTLVTSAIAMVLAVPLGIAIGLYLSLLAQRRAGAVIGPLVELLAAVPSVILGLWGILILAPFMRSTIEPALHDALGFIPLFGTPSTTGLGLFTAGVILTIMAVPIIAAISRDLFLSVSSELKDGALALGTTRWEMVRGVVLGSTRPGLVGASILGLSRALGEAVAVALVIGGLINVPGNLFAGGASIGSEIISQIQTPSTSRETASLFFLAVILLAIELIANVGAQVVVHRFERHQGGAH